MYQDYIFGFLGGGLIGAAGAGMLLSIGRIMGVSGIIGGLLRPRRGEFLWRSFFLAGIFLGGLLMSFLGSGYFTYEISRSLTQIAIGGFLVGIGTLLGNGCTSGHGVCGVSRMSPRSFLATVTFISSGVVTVYIFNAFVRL